MSTRVLTAFCAHTRAHMRAQPRAAFGRYAAHYTEKYVLMPDSFFPTDFRQTCAGLSPKGLRALPSARRLQLQPLLAAFRLFATFIPLFAEVVRFLRIVAE